MDSNVGDLEILVTDISAYYEIAHNYLQISYAKVVI